MSRPGGHQPTKCYVSLVSSIFTINGTNSTIGRALDYRPAIDAFVGRKRELRDLEISEDEWNSIKMVATWLKSFRSATTQMSATKTPMLSTTHAVFRGLQDDLRTILRDLPSSVSLSIKKGLTDAHRKLSDYYYKYNESPFYTWAACAFLTTTSPLLLTALCLQCLILEFRMKG
jgi:hypothetical protein